jgi:hypothetical protein
MIWQHLHVEFTAKDTTNSTVTIKPCVKTVDHDEDYDEANGRVISKDQHCEGKESQRSLRKAKARSRSEQEIIHKNRQTHCRRDNRLRHLVLITGRLDVEWETETRIKSRHCVLRVTQW